MENLFWNWLHLVKENGLDGYQFPEKLIGHQQLHQTQILLVNIKMKAQLHLAVCSPITNFITSMENIKSTIFLF